MSVKIDGRQMLKQKEIHRATNNEYSLIGSGDQNESEIQWVKLHQMFDR